VSEYGTFIAVLATLRVQHYTVNFSAQYV